MNNQFINWVVELIKRLGGKTPKFFTILSWIGGVAAFIGFVPDILIALDITLGEKWAPWFERALKIAGITTLIISRLPANSPVVAQQTDGTLLKVTNEKALPFTSKSELKAEAKKEEVLPTVRNIPNVNNNAGGI